MKKKILAGVLSLLVVLQLGVVAFAGDESGTSEGQTGEPAALDGNVSVDGNAVQVSGGGSPETYGITGSGTSSVEFNQSQVSCAASGIENAVGVYNESNVNIDNSTIKRDTGSTAGEGATLAAGVHVQGNDKTCVVNIDNSTVSTSGDRARGVDVIGSGTTVNINDSTISTSGKPAAGVAAVDGSKVNIEDSKVSTSGGIAIGVSTASTVEIDNSTISSQSGTAVDAVLNSNVSIEDSNVSTQSGKAVDVSDSNLSIEDSFVSTQSGNVVSASKDSNVSIKDSFVITVNGAGVNAADSTIKIDESTIVSAQGEGLRAACTNIIVTDSQIVGVVGADVTVNNSTIVVLDSTVTGTGNEDYAALQISLQNDTNPEALTIIVDTLQVTDDAPLIKVYSGGQPATDTVTEAVAKQIYYIVNSVENATVTGTQNKTVSPAGEQVTYMVANEGNELKVAVADGYELENNSQYAKMVNNGDGTYTITVMRGGDLYFTARVKYVPEAYTAEVSATATNYMKGSKDGTTQPVMVINLKASCFQKAMVDGTDLAEGSFVVGAKGNGLLTFQFSPDYIKSLSAGTYFLQVVTTQNVTHTFRLVVDADGTYTMSYYS